MKRGATILAGASGMLGSAVLESLLGEDAEVVALYRANRPQRRRPDARPNLRAIEVPSFELDILRRALAGIRAEVIVNCAGSGVDPNERDPGSLWQGNVRLVAMLLDFAAAAKVPRVIHTGSEAEYGRAAPGDLVTEGHPILPFTEYGAAKAASVAYAAASAQSLGIALLVLRPFYVFGSGERSHRLLPSIAAAGRNGRPLPMSRGDQQRDFLCAEDAARAYVAAIAAPWPDRVTVCNLCSGQARTIREVGELAARMLGLSSELLQWGAAAYRETDTPWLVGNPSRIEAVTGWRPALTLEQGIERWMSGQEPPQ